MILPANIYRAHTCRLHTLDCAEVDIDFLFGVHVRRTVRIEGVDSREIPPTKWSAALHCLVVLIAGKDLLVQVRESKSSLPVARVFLDQKLRAGIEGLVTPLWCDEPRLEVGMFFHWLAQQDYSVDVVKAVLNGKV